MSKRDRMRVGCAGVGYASDTRWMPGMRRSSAKRPRPSRPFGDGGVIVRPLSPQHRPWPGPLRAQPRAASATHGLGLEVFGFELDSPARHRGLIGLQHGHRGLESDLRGAGDFGLAADGVKEVLQMQLVRLHYRVPVLFGQKTASHATCVA